ncbi:MULTISPECIES: F0F1 ATP synthase subunit delta [Sphingosinicellaceae]|uniref:F0F1 ATP synthase subunit delta n=1 Tax=Sphingosinicellaceae TaxID=2820280 RepID=UPI001C1DF46D|nr:MULTISPECIES: F0F1 ATP synthase subunit delta [Polymorphobacter]QYE33500.1 F0F1 ATP synthase subunit delta [Polymorphobacter sp. PAMC 29334]UAJ12862.1 F0F1 ATP synthase subunit delta [Polymorphobacter megasporae]
MLIDWFTVGAQALNFLILMGLLKQFLYRPVLDAIDAREKRIDGQLADAKRQKAEAHTEKLAFGKKNADFDADRADLLTKAQAAADAEGKKLVEAARAAADAAAARRRDALKAEDVELVASIRRRTSDGVFAITRKMLADLADASLEASIGKLFLRRLESMEATAVTQMKVALASSHAAKAMVRTAFDLPADQRTAIGTAVGHLLGSDVAIDFETSPALLGGFELVVSGQKLSWSIADYLQAMQAGIDTQLEATPATKPAKSAK